MERQEEPEVVMLTLEQAAKALGVTQASVFRYVHQYKWRRFKKPGDKRTYLRGDDVAAAMGFRERKPFTEKQTS